MQPIWIRGALMTTPEEVIAAYRPNSVDHDTWRRVGPLVRETVTLANLDEPAVARASMAACTLMIVWADRTGVPLDREQIFTPDMVEHFTMSGMEGMGNRTRATRRSILRRVARAATVTAPWEPKPIRLADRHQPRPYTAADIRWWCENAQHQPTASRIQAATAVLTLGIATGLNASEMTVTTADHVQQRHGVLVVDVPGPRARIVPVRAEWVKQVEALTTAYPVGALMGPTGTSKNRMNTVLHRLIVPAGLPRLNVERLRSTWAVNVLNSRVPIAEFMRASGWITGRQIGDLLPLLAVYEPAESYRLVAGLVD